MLAAYIKNMQEESLLSLPACCHWQVHPSTGIWAYLNGILVYTENQLKHLAS